MKIPVDKCDSVDLLTALDHNGWRGQVKWITEIHGEAIPAPIAACNPTRVFRLHFIWRRRQDDTAWFAEGGSEPGIYSENDIEVMTRRAESPVDVKSRAYE